MILLSGSSGFIGKNLIDSLEKDHIPFCTIDRQTGSSFESILEVFQKHRPTIVIHLATLYIPAHQPSDIRNLLDSNIRLGVEILEAMAKTHCTRLINVGTLFQHYNNADYDPYNLYAAMKQAFEDCTKHYSNEFKIKTLHMKLADSYGPNDPRTKIYQVMIQAAQSGKTIELSPGEQFIDPLYIDDVISGFRTAIKNFDGLFKSHSLTETFRLSTGKPITLKTLASAVEQATGSKLSIQWGAKPYRARENWTPVIRFDALPGWKPETPLTQGLKLISK